MPLSSLSPLAKLWMHGACAILTTMTRRSPRHDLLGGIVKSPESTHVTRMTLEASWRVTDRQSLYATLSWLRDVGHRVTRNPATRDDLGPAGLLAYDYVRLIAIAGWGYVADLISEEEAYAFVLPAAVRLQRGYGSWEELGEAYVLGARAWTRELGHGSRQAFEVLASEDDSPWRTVPWNAPLGLAPFIRAPASSIALRRSPSLYVFSSLVMLSLAVCLLLGCTHLLH